MAKEKTTIVDVHNTVTSDELIKIITRNVKAILKDPSMSSKLPPLLIHGSPGVGKSTIVRKIAEDLGIEFYDFRLSTHEPVDIRGLPVPNKEEKSVDWFTTSEFPRDPNTKGILLFDEINACDKSLQVAAYEIILDRRLGKLYKLPDQVYVIAAGNLATDRAVAATMSSALANRFMHVEMEADPEQWVRWGLHNNINPSVLGFIEWRPNMLFNNNPEEQTIDRGWPSPRSWERVSHMIDLYGSDSKSDDPVLRKTIYGLIGNGIGVEFMEFYKRSVHFENVLTYMLNPNMDITIPERPDEKYALVQAMIYQLWRGKDATDESDRIDGFYRISMKLPADFAAMAMNAAMIGTSKENEGDCAEKLFRHASYRKWADKYGKSLHKHIII